MKKSLCLYHYFDKDAEYRDNLRYFLAHGYNTGMDFRFILAGDSMPPAELPYSAEVYHTKNHGFDFGGYAAVLPLINEEFDYYFFVNSSVRGPFLHAWNDRPWHEHFTPMLEIADLVGCAITSLPLGTDYGNLFFDRYGTLCGMGPYQHVQSTAYAMTRRALDLLLPTVFRPRDELNKCQAVIDCEVPMSQLLISAGMKISSLLDPAGTTGEGGNPMSPNGYFGRNVTPYEAMFMKSIYLRGKQWPE